MIQLQNGWGQFTPKNWGQFAPEYWGQFHAEKGGLFGRNFHNAAEISAKSARIVPMSSLYFLVLTLLSVFGCPRFVAVSP